MIHLTPEEKKSLHNTTTELESLFQLKIERFTIPYHQLMILGNYSNPDCLWSARIAEGHKNIRVALIDLQYNSREGKYASAIVREIQGYVFVRLQKDYGHLIIKPETFTDKFVEVFQRLELDFEEDKAFSNHFYVLAKDRERAIELIDYRFRDELMKFKKENFFMEVLGKLMVIGNKKSLGNKGLLELIKLARNISESRY